jgi:hypothetical protein
MTQHPPTAEHEQRKWREQHRLEAARARHKGRARREPLTRGRPTEHRLAGRLDLRRGGRFLGPRGVLDPSGCADPGRSEGEESFSIFRNPRRLGLGH